MFKLRKQTEASTCGLPGMKPLFPESMVSGLSKCWGTNPCSHLADRESACNLWSQLQTPSVLTLEVRKQGEDESHGKQTAMVNGSELFLCGSQHCMRPVGCQPSGLLELTEFSMLRSIPSSKKADSVHTLWMEETTVPLEAGTPKMKVQMESKSNCGSSEQQ